MTETPVKTRVALDLSDDDDLGLDLSAFAPRSAPLGTGASQTGQQALRDASEKQGFHARPETPVKPTGLATARAKPVKAKPATVEPAIRRRTRRKTGRVHQLNVKLTRETIEYVYDLADTRGWIVAEVIEQALALLKATPEGKAKRLRERL
jgi:hypothetical protein